MAEYAAPQSRPVVKIDRPILTPMQEQEKWLAEGVLAIKEKGIAMRQAMVASATTAVPPPPPGDGGKDSPLGAARRRRTTSCSGGFMGVVNAAALMLDELCTGALAPHNYYELYMKVFDEMQSFQQYIDDEHMLRKRSLEDMYEAVQYTGHIVARLYMLIAVGSVYMGSGEVPALTIFQDLVEMCKGEQHPTRGLFLRHFLLSMTKNLLPGDIHRRLPNDAEKDGGSPLSTARLLILNAREMNWLWIRMEAKWYGQAVRSTVGGANSTAAAARRMQSDRNELRVLVGMNIVRISQLDGIDVKMYAEAILPSLMAVIVNYREPVAQQYLFEVVVQVFPDEFHLMTLETVLDAVRYLTVTVDVCAVLRALMDRLGNYVVALREGRTEVTTGREEGILDNLVGIFLEKIEQVPVSYATRTPELKEIKRSSSAPPINPIMLGTYVNVMTSLARMAVKVHPNKCCDDISAILQCVADKFAAAPRRSVILAQEREEDASSPPRSPAPQSSRYPQSSAAETEAADAPAITPAAQQAVEKLITGAVEQIKDIHSILGMEGLVSLIAQLPFRGRRAAAVAVCEAVANSAATPCICGLDDVAQLLELLDPLLCDQEDAPADPASIYVYDPSAEFRDEQLMVCRVLHRLHNADPLVYVKMLNGVRKILGQGGPLRMFYTFPALAALYTQAALRVYAAYKDATLAVEEEKLAAKHRDPAEEDASSPTCAPAVDGSASPGEHVDGDTEAHRAGSSKRKQKSTKAAEDVEDEDEGGNGGTNATGNDTKKRVQQLAKQLVKIFRHLHSGDGKGLLEILSATDSTGNAESGSSTAAFHAYLTAANAADTCELPDACYELYAEALLLYEDHAADSRSQIDMLASLVNSLYVLANMPEDGYRTLATKACRYCSKLVKKHEQSRMVAQCANLFAKKKRTTSEKRTGKTSTKDGSGESGAQGMEQANGSEEPKETNAAGEEEQAMNEGDENDRSIALECLDRALKTAKQVVVPLQQLALYVDLLNIFLHFFASKTIQLESRYVNSVVDSIRTLSEAQRDGSAASTTTADTNGSDSDSGESAGEDPGAERVRNKQSTGSLDEPRGGKPARRRGAGKRKPAEPAKEEGAQDAAASMGATYEAVRQIYRNTTKYIRTRQSVDPRWEEIEV